MLLMVFIKLKLVVRGNLVYIYIREINDDVICGVKFLFCFYVGDEVLGWK